MCLYMAVSFAKSLTLDFILPHSKCQSLSLTHLIRINDRRWGCTRPRQCFNSRTFFHQLSFKITYTDRQELLLSDFFQASYDIILEALSELIESKTKHNKDNHANKKCVANTLEDTTTFHDEVEPSYYPHLLDTDNHEAMDSSTPSVDLLSYGIGRFSSCPIARYQLAFLLLLRKKFNHPPCYVYDPMFTSHEKVALRDTGISLIEVNEEGKRICHVPTLAFMPHCGKALYNNLIWANLNSPRHDGVHNLVLIGNSFSSMIDRTPERQLLKTANYVIKINPYTEETALPLFRTHMDIFNDLAIHSFPRQKFDSLTLEFSTDNPEPVYDEEEVEMIRNKGKS